MGESSNEPLRGTIDLLVLRTLSLAPMHARVRAVLVDSDVLNLPVRPRDRDRVIDHGHLERLRTPTGAVVAR